MIPFLYTVEELNRLNHVRSRLYTRDFFLALADWMIRAHKPLGFPPGSKASTGDLRIAVVGYHIPIEDMRLDLQGSFLNKAEVVRTFTVKTSIATGELEEGFTERSGNVYKTPEYWEALHKMKGRIERFCLEQHHSAYLLAQFAARDHQHPFWKPTMYARSRGLSF